MAIEKFTKLKKRDLSVELAQHLCVLASYADNNNEIIGYKPKSRLTKIFYHKSGTELRLEASQKMKLITA
jgi:hypothetical protein